MTINVFTPDGLIPKPEATNLIVEANRSRSGGLIASIALKRQLHGGDR